MAELKINEVDVRRLLLQPGEVLVVTTKHLITAETAARLRQQLQDAFVRAGAERPEIFISDSLEFEIIKAAALSKAKGEA